MNIYGYLIRIMPQGYAGTKDGIKVIKTIYPEARETPKMVVSECIKICKESLDHFIMSPTSNIYPEVKVEFYTTKEQLAYKGIDNRLTVSNDEYVKLSILAEIERLKNVFKLMFTDTDKIYYRVDDLRKEPTELDED